MTEQEVVDLINEALELDPGELQLDVPIKSVGGWTSMGWLSILAALDEKLGMQLESKVIRSFVTVRDFVAHVQSKAAN